MSQGPNITLDESNGRTANRMRETASGICRKASEYGRNAAGKVDEGLRSVAGKLENASSSMHRRADGLPGGQRVSGIAHKAADGLHSAAEYVRTHDTNTIKHDTENTLRRHPVQSLVVAAVGGFLVGRMVRNAR
ncbi:MAG: hypothetical protein WD696_17015 [Bryobacteraceae bacterium]